MGLAGDEIDRPDAISVDTELADAALASRGNDELASLLDLDEKGLRLFARRVADGPGDSRRCQRREKYRPKPTQLEIDECRCYHGMFTFLLQSKL